MGRGPQAEEVPNLAHALRWLRGRAGISQAQVAERVHAAGGHCSTVFYRQVETGRRFPSPERRAQMLGALGSDEAELRRVLAERPWGAAPPAGARRTPSSWSDPVVLGAGPDPQEVAALLSAFRACAPADRAALLADARRRAGGRARDPDAPHTRLPED